MSALAGIVPGWRGKSELEKYIWKYRAAAVIATLLAPLPLPLGLLLRMFGSDKQIPGRHSYGSTYGPLLRRWKYRRVKLLEIGVGGERMLPGGRSLLAWRAFFPSGTIIGCDIVPKAMLAGHRRRIYQIDQSAPGDLAMLQQREAPFDIIIDDGSHLNRHQIISFRSLFPALKDGGIYVIEDVQTLFWRGHVDGLAMEWDGAPVGDPEFRYTCVGWFLELASYLNYAEFIEREGLDQEMLTLARQIVRIAFEHNLIIIHKGTNHEASAFVHAPAHEQSA